MTKQLRITTENRTRLETVIPLSTPYLVFLDPSNICNQQCKFCPTGNRELIKTVGREQTMMNWNLYRYVIDQLTGFPEQIKTLRLYKDGEPLLNSLLPEMINYARETGKFKQIDTTTNGRLLSPRTTRKIVLAGLNKIFISVPFDYDETYIFNIAYFYEYSRRRCEMFLKIAGDYLIVAEQQKFLDTFTPFCDGIAIEHTAPCWPEFHVPCVNLSVGIYGQEISKEVDVCPYIFYSTAINSNGTVSLCFLDWQQRYLLGDLKTGNIVDTWNSNKLKMYQISHLKKNRRNIKFCKDCRQLLYGMPDDIDQYAGEILGRMHKQ
jgi:radical SAM protein with 4Fe4S-binding SPASM domain